MALVGVAYAQAKRRRQIMVATSSVGLGAGNMVTAPGCSAVMAIRTVGHEVTGAAPAERAEVVRTIARPRLEELQEIRA